MSLAISRESLELADDSKPAEVFNFRQLSDTGLLYPLLGLGQLFIREPDLFTDWRGITYYPLQNYSRYPSRRQFGKVGNWIVVDGFFDGTFSEEQRQ